MVVPDGNDGAMEQTSGWPFVRTMAALPVVNSTSVHAAELIQDVDLELPLAVWTLSQTHGRGRGSREWWSDAGSLTFTVAIDPARHGLAPPIEPRLALATGVAVIDAQSYDVLRYLLVGQRVWSLAFNPDQSRLYTTNGVSNDITVIDVGSLKAIKSVPVGQSPWGVVSRP